MADDFKFSVEAHFADSRPLADVKYDVEKRVKRLLPRDLEQPDALVFSETAKSATTTGTNIIELRVEGAFDTGNLYALRLDYEGPCTPTNQKSWSENMRRTMGRWTEGFARAESLAGASPERFRQLLDEPTERAPHQEDPAAILAIQQSILARLRAGKRFFTAHHEGGTNIKWLGDRFVFQDYGESEDREEFSTEAEFFDRLRKFYDWQARFSWMPHPPPEVEVWKFIDHELN